MHRTKPPPEVGHIANQISALPVAPAAESQKLEIVTKLNDLAVQMKLWAAQVEGFASHLNTLAVHGAQSPANPHLSSRAAPTNDQLYIPYPNPQHYPGSPQYQLQQYSQSGRLPSTPIADYPGAQLSKVSPVSLASGTPTPDDGEKPGKRRRRTDSTRRKKDPLAPKRPPSAYILYQNDVRKQMQGKYSEMSYTEVLGKISESWQSLEESKKKVYLNMVERDKLRYEDEKLRYNSGQDVPSKPTPRRPLSALRAPSDPDPDADAEGENELEEEEGTEETEQDEQEHPDTKRTKLGNSHNGNQHQEPGAQSAESHAHPHLQSQPTHVDAPNQTGFSPPQPRTPVPVGIPPQQPPQPYSYHPSSAQHIHYSQHIPVPQPSPSPQSQSQPSPQAAHISPQIVHTTLQSQGMHASPQLVRASPQVTRAAPVLQQTRLAHTSPHIAHASPRVAHSSPHVTHASPQVAHASPQLTHPTTHRMQASPHQAHLQPQPQPRHPISMLPMPHLTHASQPRINASNGPAA